MSNESEGNDPRTLWQAQSIDAPRISLQFVRSRIHDLKRRAWRRNAFEYVVGALGIIVSAWFIWAMPLHVPILKVGMGLTGLAGVWVIFRWHRNAAAQDVAADLGVLDALAFYRRQLERQRDVRKSNWRWYLLPFAPGIVLLLAGILIEFDPAPWAHFWFGVGWTILVIGTGVFVNERAARRLQQDIDALNSLHAVERGQ